MQDLLFRDLDFVACGWVSQLPLPDTLHLLFSWFVCVRVRVWSRVRVLARLLVPVLVALLVALASRSTPVQWFHAHTDCACAKYIVLL